jgi:hypothetical protein
MSITDISQLPEDLRNAAAPAAPAASLPTGIPTDGGPMPTPNAPVSGVPGPVGLPAGMNPPEVAATTPIPFSQALQSNTNAASAATPPAAANVPGHWARTLIAGALKSLPSAINNVETSLGDMSAANEEIQKSHPAGGAGILDYIGAQQNAKNNRIQAAQVAQTAEDKSRADIAMSNVQRMYHQQLLHQMSDEANHKDIANGIAQIEALTTHNVELGLAPAKKLFTNISDSQYSQLVQSGKVDPTKTSFIPDGSTQPLDPKTGKLMVDENNQPVLSKTFTVLEPPKDQVLTDAQVDRINKYVPSANLPRGTESHPVIIPGISAISYMEMANAAETYQAKAALDLSKAGAEKLDADQKIASDNASSELAKNSLYLKAVAHFPNDLATLYRFMTGAYPEIGPDGKPTGKMDPGSLEAAKTNAGQDIILKYGGEKGYSKVVEDQAKDFEAKRRDDEKERKDRADEAEKAQAEKDKKTAQDFNPPSSANLTGDAYLKTLPLPQQNLLISVGEGRNTTVAIQNRKGELTPLGLALTQAYPDYDITKAKDYQKLRTDFITGPTSKALTSYGTAMNHGRLMYDNTGNNSYIPGTAEFTRYNQDALYLATEVAKALNPTGVASEGTVKEQVDALTSRTNRKAAIENAEHILTGKMAEIRQRWANGQVRPSYQPPMPGLSKEATDNADYVRNHGQAPPAPNTHVFNATTWAAAHPGQDINAAIAQAKAQGYQVKQ